MIKKTIFPEHPCDSLIDWQRHVHEQAQPINPIHELILDMEAMANALEATNYDKGAEFIRTAILKYRTATSL